MLEGLCYLHQKRIIHRDLKVCSGAAWSAGLTCPQAGNLLISTSNVVKLADLGVAKKLHDTVADVPNNKNTNLQTMVRC